MQLSEITDPISHIDNVEIFCHLNIKIESYQNYPFFKRHFFCRQKWYNSRHIQMCSRHLSILRSWCLEIGVIALDAKRLAVDSVCVPSQPK